METHPRCRQRQRPTNVVCVLKAIPGTHVLWVFPCVFLQDVVTEILLKKVMSRRRRSGNFREHTRKRAESIMKKKEKKEREERKFYSLSLEGKQEEDEGSQCLHPSSLVSSARVCLAFLWTIFYLKARLVGEDDTKRERKGKRARRRRREKIIN